MYYLLFVYLVQMRRLREKLLHPDSRGLYLVDEAFYFYLPDSKATKS